MIAGDELKPPVDDGPPIDYYDGYDVPVGHGGPTRVPRMEEPLPQGMEHLPPMNLEAEEAILGALLMSPDACRIAHDVGLLTEHFYRPSHRIIHQAILEQLDTTGMVDELAIVNVLRRQTVKDVRGNPVNALVAAGGAAAVLALPRRTPAIANAAAYAQDVVDYAVKRSLVEIGHEVAAIGYDMAVTPDESVAACEALLLGAASAAGAKHQSGELIDSSSSMDRWLANYRRLQDADAYESETLSWGRAELDDAYGRLVRGGVYVPAGWTKHGKTWFVLDVLEAVVEQGERVYLASGEMSDEEIDDRLVAMGGHDYTAVQEKRIPQSVLQDRVDRIKGWSYDTATGRITVARLRADVARARLEGRPYRLVILDHLHLVKPDRGAKWQPKNDFLDDVCSELKALAEEFGFTLLLVCQLKKPDRAPGEHQAYKRPPAEDDLKGAAAIPQIATTVIFVYKLMDKEKGRFKGRRAVLLSPWHRLRPQHPRIDVEFTVPGRIGRPAYRYVPSEEQRELIEESAAPARQALEATFGPVQIVMDDDDGIPF